MRFDAQGYPNGWLPRAVGAWFLPAVALGLWALLRRGVQILPSPWRARTIASPTGITAALSVGLLCVIQCALLVASVTTPGSLQVSLSVSLGVYWLGLGLLLPRVRRNPWIGVRTPWTLTSDETWARTHRIAGITFCLGGLAACAGAVAGASLLFSMSCLVVTAVVPASYSFFVARTLRPEGSTDISPTRFATF
jgi:hypothetical protein